MTDIFKIRGVVREKESKIGVGNLLVKAYDKDLLYDDLMGNASTKPDGTFEIISESDDFRDFFEKHPDIYLKIMTYDGKRVIYTTERAVRWETQRQAYFEVYIPRKVLGDLSPSKNKKICALEVAVYDYKFRPLEKAVVTLTPSGEKIKAINLQFDKQKNLFRRIGIAPGNYYLQVKSKNFESDQRDVRVDPSELKETFILGKKDMPFYYRGKVKVPFEPPRDLIGASLKHDLHAKDENKLLAYARELKLEPEKVKKQIRKENVRVFRYRTNTSDQDKMRIQLLLSKHPTVEFVGPLVKVDEETVSFLTNDLIVKFKNHISREEVPAFAKRFKLNVVRHIPYAGNTYQLRSEAPASYDILTICAEIVKTGMVEYAEPDLFSTAVDDQVNPTDFLYLEQWHLPLINASGAWQALANINPNLTFGGPDVIIAVVDSGVDENNRDFSGTLTNGSPKVYELYDFANMQPNNNNLPSSHGTGCAGAATAQADNLSPVAGQNEGVVGVAGNCRLIGIRRSGPESRYSDAYVWLAGFNPNSPTPGFPTPISPGADIITNSFGYSTGIPISGLMSDTFDFLTTYGRDGKGILLFFSVGNFLPSQDYTLQRPWAAYEKTFAIAASTLANDGVTEIISTYSGFGGAGIVDLCAPSHDEYVGERPFHHPIQNYGGVTCDVVGQGNMPGHAAVQTALSQAVASAPLTTLNGPAMAPAFVWIPPGTLTLDVGNNAGFAVNQWVRLGQHGDDNAEWVQITAIPLGGNQLTTTATTQFHLVGSPVVGSSTLNVNSSVGFVADQWLFLGQPGQAGAESVLIREVPAGNTQIRVAGPLYNHGVNSQVVWGSNDYRNSHGGTSFSTPVCAGVAALVLSANPDLTWVQARKILRDTAAHIDSTNVDPIGQWVDTDGDGAVDYSRWYGFGRVDAQAAVQEAINLIGVSPLTNIDTWIKENTSDIGDVPSLPPYSPDVWVRNVDPALDNPAEVDQHQSPIRGQDNWIYAKIRNRGAVDSLDVYVRIFLTRWAGTQYIYPDDFIPTNRPGTNPTQPLEPGTYLIDEWHIDSIPAGGDVTINTKWPAALVPPASVVINGVTYSWADACLLVDVSPHDGPSPTGNHTWDNNNICQKNVFPVDSTDSDDLAIAFVVGHRLNNAEIVNLRIERKNLPAGVRLFVDYVDEKMTKKVTKFLSEIETKHHFLDSCDLTILTKALGKIECNKTGRASHIIIPPKTHLTFPCCPSIRFDTDYDLKPVLEKGRMVFAVPTMQRSYAPILRKRGKHQVVALVAKGLKNLKKGRYQIDLYQENLIGKVDGALNFIIHKE